MIEPQRRYVIDDIIRRFYATSKSLTNGPKINILNLSLQFQSDHELWYFNSKFYTSYNTTIENFLNKHYKLNAALFPLLYCRSKIVTNICREHVTRLMLRHHVLDFAAAVCTNQDVLIMKDIFVRDLKVPFDAALAKHKHINKKFARRLSYFFSGKREEEGLTYDHGQLKSAIRLMLNSATDLNDIPTITCYNIAYKKASLDFYELWGMKSRTFFNQLSHYWDEHLVAYGLLPMEEFLAKVTEGYTVKWFHWTAMGTPGRVAGDFIRDPTLVGGEIEYFDSIGISYGRFDAKNAIAQYPNIHRRLADTVDDDGDRMCYCKLLGIPYMKFREPTLPQLEPEQVTEKDIHEYIEDIVNEDEPSEREVNPLPEPVLGTPLE